MVASLSSAQNVTVKGDVFDPLAGEGIHEAVVKIMNVENDSVIATTKSLLNFVEEKRGGVSTSYQDTKSGAVFSIAFPAKYKAVVLVVSAAGYESERKKLEISPEKKHYDIGTINLLPAMKEKRLNEATVTATKIKMYYKGDTLVYNADAFNIQKNENLRKLVEQLPNTKIEDGVIYVNGKPVESLLFSGKDFFNGNIQGALDRLPAYIVSKVKVYDKQGDMSELTGRDMHDKQYVMDVHLKREYLGTWMAKVQADVATENLWGGQGFLMRMDDRQMLSINADINNFNESRQMYDIATMVDVIPEGRHKNKVANLEYFYEPNGMWRFSSNASVRRTEQRTDTWTNTETFLSPANMMAKNKAFRQDESTRVNARAALRARKVKKWQSELAYDFNFNNDRNAQDALTLAFWMKDNEAWQTWDADSIYANILNTEPQSLLYTLLNPTLSKQKSFTYKPGWKTSLVLNGNTLNIDLQVNHNKVQTDVFNNYKLDYYSTQDADHRRIYKDQDEHRTTIDASVDYAHKFNTREGYDAIMTPYVSFKHETGNLSHPYYRLERMLQWSEALDWTSGTLGVLPDEEWRALCFDAENSYYSKNHGQTGKAGIRASQKIIRKDHGTWQFDADLGGVLQHKKLDYTRGEQPYEVSKHAVSFKPAFTLQYQSAGSHKWMPEFHFDYNGEYQMPDLLNLLPIVDKADPLNEFRGNGALGGMYSHNALLRYSLTQRKNWQNVYVTLQYLRVHNDIATSSTFNAENGGRIYSMCNTNRTHAVGGEMGYSTPIDKKQNFSITFSVRGKYRQNADLSYIGFEDNGCSLLRQYGFTPSVVLRGAVGQNFRFSGRWNTAFTTVRQKGVETQYRETSVKADFNWTLPLRLQLASDFRLSLYHGFADASINKAHYNWNASLARTFLNDKLTMRLIAHGLLTPKNNIQSIINATSRVETYTDILPRYFMLSLVYNLEWTQKRHNK